MPLEHVGTSLDSFAYASPRRRAPSGATVTRAASDAQHNARVRARRKREEAAANGDEDTQILSKLTGVNRSVSWGRSYRGARFPESPGARPSSLGMSTSKGSSEARGEQHRGSERQQSDTSSPASSSALSLRSVSALAPSSSRAREIPSPTKATNVPIWSQHISESPVDRYTLPSPSRPPFAVNKELPSIPTIDVETNSPVKHSSPLERTHSADPRILEEKRNHLRQPSWIELECTSIPCRSVSTAGEGRVGLPDAPPSGMSRRRMNAYFSHPRRSSPNLALGLINAPDNNARATRSLVTSPTQEQFLSGNGKQLPDLFSHLYLASKSTQGAPMDSQLSPNGRENDRGWNAAPDYLQNISQILPRPPRSPMISAQPSPDHDISDDEGLGPVTMRHRLPPSTAKAEAEPEEPVPSSLADYVLGPEMGRGAYGFVHRARYAREFNESEYPLLIKFIYKNCILADSWRRHRIYGVLPAEIFVLMQVQSMPYDPPAEVPPYIIDKPFWIKRRDELLEKQKNGISVGQPTICGLLDFFEDPEYYYMVMPRFGEGRDLFDEVESCLFGLDMTHVRCYLGQLAEALAILHANSLVHRDIKDENVIIDSHAMIQLIDFGSAARLRAGRMFDTFSGTLDYAAAEILEGKPYAGPPQDVWAFGVVAFVLVCGECPFRDGTEACEGLKENSRPLDLLRRVCNYSSGTENDGIFLNDDDAVPTDHRPAVAGDSAAHDVTDLIQQCLLLNPDERPTASDLLAHRFIRGPGGWLGANRSTDNVL